MIKSCKHRTLKGQEIIQRRSQSVGRFQKDGQESTTSILLRPGKCLKLSTRKMITVNSYWQGSTPRKSSRSIRTQSCCVGKNQGKNVTGDTSQNGSRGNSELKFLNSITIRTQRFFNLLRVRSTRTLAVEAGNGGSTPSPAATLHTWRIQCST